jgi:hypothetical protein
MDFYKFPLLYEENNLLLLLNSLLRDAILRIIMSLYSFKSIIKYTK